MGVYGYGQAQKKADESKGESGVLLSLSDDGDRAMVAFIGDVYAFDQVWDEDANKSMDAESDEGVEYLSENPDVKPRFKARWNVMVITRASGEDDAIDLMVKVGDMTADDIKRLPKTTQVFEQGKLFFGDAKKRHRRNKPDTYLFEIERSGAKGDNKTRYTINPGPQISKVPGLTKHLRGVTLRDLANPFADIDGEGGDGGDGGDDGGKASKSKGGKKLDADQRAELKDKLRSVDRSVLTEFLNNFGITKIKDLPGSKFDDAIGWIDAKSGADDAADNGAENDPFAD